MNLEEYLEKENVVKLDISFKEFEELIKKDFGEEKLKEYLNLAEALQDLCIQENIKKFYSHIFENNMENYFEGTFTDRTMQEMPLVNARMKGHSNVLDIGCSYGLKTAFYALNNRDAQFTGIDITGTALEKARVLAEKYCCKNINYLEMDMLEMNFENRFDFVIADHSLHETESVSFHPYESGSDPCFGYKLKKIHEVMDKGQLIVILTPSDMEYLKEELLYLENSAGFKVKDVREINYLKFRKEMTDLVIISDKG